MINIIDKLSAFFQSNEYKAEKSTDLFLGNTIAEISKNILVSQDKLLEKAQEGKLKSYLDKKAKKYGPTLEKSKEDYKKIVSQYHKNKDGTTLDGKDFQISEDLLMKIVRKSNFVLSESIGIESEEDRSEFIPLYLKNHPNLFIQDKNNELLIYRDEGSSLGKGGCSNVNKIALLSAGKFAALKISKVSDEELIKEYNLLNKIHNKGRIKHIQKPPLALGYLKDNDKNVEALIGPIYQVGALDKFIDVLNKNIKIDLSFQMLKSAKALKDQGIIHGDIKLPNFLVSKNKEGSFVVDIADIGGGLFTKIDLNFLNTTKNNNLGTIASPQFITEKDFTMLINASSKKKIKEWINLNFSRDLFALTASLWHLLTGKPPFAYDKSNFPIVKAEPNNLDLMEKLVSKETLEILKNILTLSPPKRPSLEMLLESFEKNEMIKPEKLINIDEIDRDDDEGFQSFTSL